MLVLLYFTSLLLPHASKQLKVVYYFLSETNLAFRKVQILSHFHLNYAFFYRDFDLIQINRYHIITIDNLYWLSKIKPNVCIRNFKNVWWTTTLLPSGKSKEAQTTVFSMLERNLGDKLRLSLTNLELSTNSDPSISGISLTKLFYRPIQG